MHCCSYHQNLNEFFHHCLVLAGTLHSGICPHTHDMMTNTNDCNKMLISNSLIKSFQPEHICNTSETANWRGKSKSGNKKSDTETMDNAMRGHYYYLPFSHNHQVPWLQFHYMTLYFCSDFVGAKILFWGTEAASKSTKQFSPKNVFKNFKLILLSSFKLHKRKVWRVE